MHKIMRWINWCNKTHSYFSKKICSCIL